MNPLVERFVGSFVRWALTGVGAWFVSKGITTEGEWLEYVGGLVVIGVPLVWSLLKQYTDRARFLNALNAPKGASEDSVKGQSAPPIAVMIAKQ
jgi:hypothetical protein